MSAIPRHTSATQNVGTQWNSCSCPLLCIPGEGLWNQQCSSIASCHECSFRLRSNTWKSFRFVASVAISCTTKLWSIQRGVVGIIQNRIILERLLNFEDRDASQRGSSIVDGAMERSNSVMSQGDTLIPSRGGTLKKKASIKRGSSLRRSSSRRSSRAGSVRSLALQAPGDVDEMHSAFFSPVPTTGNPTDILSNRFQGMKQGLTFIHPLTNELI